MLLAVENGVPIWSTLTLKGTAAHRTPTGSHRILRQVPNETMSIPAVQPGGIEAMELLFSVR